MQVNKNYLVELKLKDLFFHVAYRWRSILLVALVFALALGGLQYLSARKAENSAADAADPELTGILKYREEVLDGQKEYIEESPYIRLDATSVWRAEKVWLVRPADESVSADSILPAYGAPLAGVSDEELEQVFGTAAYAGELVRVTVSGESDTVTVRVLAADRETAEQGMAFVAGKMEAIAAGTAAKIGAHELMPISDSVAAGPDAELEEKQQILLENMTASEKLVKEGREKLQQQKATPPAAIRSAVKKAVIAFVLAFILMCGLYAVLYAVNGRLKSGEELAGRYGTAVLGELFRSGAKHPGKGIDGLMEKLEGKNRQPEEAVVFEQLAALAEGWEGAGKIAIVSTLDGADVKSLQEQLGKRLQGKEIITVTGFAKNGKAVSEAVQADAVLLAEEKNVTRRQDLQNMAEALVAGKANVVGAVMI